jgi:hypothetical protein
MQIAPALLLMLMLGCASGGDTYAEIAASLFKDHDANGDGMVALLRLPSGSR